VSVWFLVFGLWFVVVGLWMLMIGFVFDNQQRVIESMFSGRPPADAAPRTPTPR